MRVISNLKSTSTRPAPVTLSVPTTPCYAGTIVDGEVVLEFSQLHQEDIQEIHVKLLGEVKTTIRCNKVCYCDGRTLVEQSIPLWKRKESAVYPLPGSNILRLLFRFPLPDDLPPSFQFRGRETSAYIVYSVTAVGVRPGTFTSNRRISSLLLVLPRPELAATIRRELDAGVGWRHVDTEKSIRRRPWGEPATVNVKFSLPDMLVFPLNTNIPYIINVVSTTAPLPRSKADAHPAGKSIFPAPPALHSQLVLRLVRRVEVHARGLFMAVETDVKSFLGQDTERTPTVDTDLPDKEWVCAETQAGEETGKWVQRATYKSTFRLSVVPTFSGALCRCEYSLYLRVPFPGLWNDVKVKVPITVVSGKPNVPQDPPPPPFSSGIDGLGSSSSPDLLPGYWDIPSS